MENCMKKYELIYAVQQRADLVTEHELNEMARPSTPFSRALNDLITKDPNITNAEIKKQLIDLDIEVPDNLSVRINHMRKAVADKQPSEKTDNESNKKEPDSDNQPTYIHPAFQKQLGNIKRKQKRKPFTKSAHYITALALSTIVQKLPSKTEKLKKLEEICHNEGYSLQWADKIVDKYHNMAYFVLSWGEKNKFFDKPIYYNAIQDHQLDKVIDLIDAYKKAQEK